MGGGTKLSKEERRQSAYTALSSHPNFHFPELPELSSEADAKAAVEFALEAVANYISPPKVPGESVSYTCLQLADSIRHDLLAEVLKKLGLKEDVK